MPKKNDMKSNSKILKCIVASLEKGKFTHVLKWIDRAKKEFSILFVHKSNPTWHVSYLDLFKELDGLSKKKWENYLQKEDYESACKVRCKSNLQKLCTEGVLSKCWKIYENKSKFSICYRINDTSGIQVPLLKDLKMQKNQTHALSLMSFQDSDGDCSSYNILKNPDDMGDGRVLPYEGMNAVCNNNAENYGSGELYALVPNDSFGINKELPYEEVKTMCDNNAENYESREHLLDPNGLFGIKKELPYERMEAMCENNAENYESREHLLYPNAENDSFGINKVSCTLLDEVNSDINAVIPEQLYGAETSFDLNKLILQGDVRMEEIFNACLNTNNITEAMATNVQDIDIMDEAGYVLQMNEDPFICCGSRGLCNCQQNDQIVASNMF